MAQTIILIGPMGAGKTTVGERLAERLNLKRVELDEIRWGYYEEIGYSNEVAKAKHEAGGMAAIIAYWKPFEAHSVARVVEDYRDCVIDLGGGHTVYEDEALLEQVKRALEPYPNVVLLLPSADVDETIRVLEGRIPAEVPAENREWYQQLNEHFIRHRSNGELAKITVYTEGKTVDETCDEIMGKLK